MANYIVLSEDNSARTQKAIKRENKNDRELFEGFCRVKMKRFAFQKQVFERYQVKDHKERSDKVITSIISTIIAGKNSKRSSKILDVGCGGGQLLETFAKTSNIELYGVDIAENALKMARKRGYEVFLYEAESENMPFKSNIFDIVVMNDLLEHIVEPDVLLKEAHRVLENDGNLIISVPNISQPVSWFMQIFLDLPPMQSARYKSVHIRDYTLRLLRIVLKLNGFEVKMIRGTYLYPFDNTISRVLAGLFPRLSERIIVVSEKGTIPEIALARVYFDIRNLES